MLMPLWMIYFAVREFLFYGFSFESMVASRFHISCRHQNKSIWNIWLLQNLYSVLFDVSSIDEPR